MATMRQKQIILDQILSTELKDISQYEELFKQNNYNVTVKAKRAAKFFQFAETIKILQLDEKINYSKTHAQLHITDFSSLTRKSLETLGFDYDHDRGCFIGPLLCLDTVVGMLLGADVNVYKSEAVSGKEIWGIIKTHLKDPIGNVYKNELSLYPNYLIDHVAGKRAFLLDYVREELPYCTYKFSSYQSGGRYFISVKVYSEDSHDKTHLIESPKPLTAKRLIKRISRDRLELSKDTRSNIAIYTVIFEKMMSGELDWSKFAFNERV